MNEITKACQSCGGRGRYGDELLGVHKCPRCDNGRVPDVVATLRAQLDELREATRALIVELSDDECDRLNKQVLGRVAALVGMVRR